MHKISKLKYARVCSCGRVFVSCITKIKEIKEHLSTNNQKEAVDGDKTTDGESNGVPEEGTGTKT